MGYEHAEPGTVLRSRDVEIGCLGLISQPVKATQLLLHPLSAPMTLRWLRDRFADRRVNEHKTRTVWPTMFNPSTYLGMAELGVITAKVVLGRSGERQPLSTTDAQ